MAIIMNYKKRILSAMEEAYGDGLTGLKLLIKRVKVCEGDEM